MTRNVFYSFHYIPDCWRASQVRNMGVIEGNTPVSDNDWEEVKKGGDTKIEKWINEQMQYKSCAIVLVGENTAGRKWINYEISHAWDSGLGVVGICVHNLLDSNQNQAKKGSNPFVYKNVGETRLSSIVNLYDPPYLTSKYVYDDIKNKIADLVEDAIAIRKKY